MILNFCIKILSFNLAVVYVDKYNLRIKKWMKKYCCVGFSNNKIVLYIRELLLNNLGQKNHLSLTLFPILANIPLCPNDNECT
jgi:hypothetical protein